MARIAANPDAVRKMDFADLMRDAADAGIVRDARSYVRYRELRNKTSHTYDADRAEKTVSVVHEFLRDVRFLLQELWKRNGSAHSARPRASGGSSRPSTWR